MYRCLLLCFVRCLYNPAPVGVGRARYVFHAYVAVHEQHKQSYAKSSVCLLVLILVNKSLGCVSLSPRFLVSLTLARLCDVVPLPL